MLKKIAADEDFMSKKTIFFGQESNPAFWLLFSERKGNKKLKVVDYMSIILSFFLISLSLILINNDDPFFPHLITGVRRKAKSCLILYFSKETINEQNVLLTCFFLIHRCSG